MIHLSEVRPNPSNFGGLYEPEQHTAIAAETSNQNIQIGFWESGPGVLNLDFKWTETVYILEGRAEVTNLKTQESFSLTPGMMALFEAGSQWSWQIPWKLKKIFTVVDSAN